MALQSYGILGPVSQKIGNVVGAKWKNRHYFKTLVTPSNPNTAAQQAHRAIFAAVVAAARLILTTVIRPYWDPFYNGISGFNAFVKENIGAMVGTFDWADFIVSKGSLEGAIITSADYAVDTVSIHWDDTTHGNGTALDWACGVVYDAIASVAWVSDNNEQRADQQSDIVVGSGRTAGNLKAYLFFHREENSRLEVSNSSYAQVA